MSSPSDDPDDLSPADRAVADMIAALPDEELPEGAEERLLARVEREGVIGLRRVASLTDILALIHAAAARLPGDTSDYEAIVRRLSPAVFGLPMMLVEAVTRAYAEPLLGPLVVAAARAYEEETREVDAAMEEDAACTGLTARWCPRCGDCTCDPDPADLDAPTCPLHGQRSRHAEGRVNAP